MNELTKIFKYEQKEISVIIRDNEVWFVARDICDILGLKNVTDSLKKLDEDEKLIYKISRAGQERDVNFVSEPGLYKLIFSSNKDEAKLFTRWVTHEVLPSIRKTGGYTLNFKDGYKLASLVSRTAMNKLPMISNILKQSGIELDLESKGVEKEPEIPIETPKDRVNEFIASGYLEFGDYCCFVSSLSESYKLWCEKNDKEFSKGFPKYFKQIAESNKELKLKYQDQLRIGDNRDRNRGYTGVRVAKLDIEN